MSRDPLKPGGALGGRLFQGFLTRLSEIREPEAGDRIGPWEIGEELGRGGSGVVFLAERADGAFSQQVALKWLRGDRPVPGGRQVLARERELLASLDHPHIARLIDGGETGDGQLWFAMDYVAGETVDRHAARLGRRDRLRLVATVCRAAHHAHRRGLIHGDIKPSNVLVDDRGQPRLVDFGIARLKGSAFGTSYGLTPDYASPEQRRGDALTTASDIWQLGRLLDDLMRGQPAGRDLRAIVARATSGSPEDRYASAAAMAADIEAWLNRRPVTAYGGGPGYRLLRMVQRNVALSVVAVLALMVIAGGGAWMTWQLAEERDTARSEAARAEAALAESEAALAQAEALRDFLVDLFRATRPDRPADQLPSTSELLARGAGRAMDPRSAPPAERFGMLSALGEVYLARSHYDEARPLLEEALVLAREHKDITAIEHARALQRRADLMIRAGDDLDRVEALLADAEATLPDGVDTWATLARIRITRTWIERHRGDHGAALALVEPVHARMPDDDVDPALRASLLDSLAGLNAATGNLAAAARFRRQATDAFRKAQGPEGQGYVVSLANSAGLEQTLGRFAEAEKRARQALELYDRIYTDPMDYRASLRNTLARTLLARGEIDSAFAVLEQAGREYARFMDSAFEDWPLYFSLRGAFHLRLGHSERAVPDMEKAHRLIHEQGDWDTRLVATLDMLLAWARCRAGDGEAGHARLEEIAEPGILLARPRNAAQYHEARAACLHATGEGEPALVAIDQALDAHDSPGAVMAAADRHILRARILADLERPAEAGEALATAERRFTELGLEDHPRVADIRALRGELL